jgi:hypothetical protein
MLRGDATAAMYYAARDFFLPESIHLRFLTSPQS